MVDPEIEAPLRKMLAHVMRGETDDALELAEEIGPQRYESAVALAIAASGYIAVSTSRRWPQEADVQALARNSVKAPHSQVTEAEIHDYLARVVLASENPLTVFEGSRAALIPLFATANLLLRFSGEYEDQWKYLDAIWNSLDAAEATSTDVAPGVVYLYSRK
jgi:hypothetical protein